MLRWNTEFSPANAAHLPQASTCCAFGDAFRHPGCGSHYLRYLCLPVSLNQSGHSPLIMQITGKNGWVFCFYSNAVYFFYRAVVTNTFSQCRINKVLSYNYMPLLSSHKVQQHYIYIYIATIRWGEKQENKRKEPQEDPDPILHITHSYNWVLNSRRSQPWST